ncbi:pore-forming ESAT-6 family protein [Cohnella sp. GCM10027633]|uniref:pore-forming ESAT-6 family protein n=1 Tax=unclassified Cohnella TaxID=2636738 RepID=UPI003643ECB4
MAAIGIDITLDQLTQTATNINKLNEQLTDRLEFIRKEMKDLSNSWQSEAAEELRKDFESYVPKFEEYRKVVESYATFLTETARLYDETETQLKSNANLFK